MCDFSRLLLLAMGCAVVAACMCASAHGHDQRPRPLLRFVTSSVEAAAVAAAAVPPVVDAAADAAAAAVDAAGRHLKAPSTPLASVVEDWSLVCTELCGAGLGGVQCATSCRTGVAAHKSRSSTTPLNDAFAMILQSNKDLICRDLCSMQLGGSKCACESALMLTDAASTVDGTVDAASRVCHTFCVHANITLSGCSACDATADGDGDGRDVVAAVHQALALAKQQKQQRQEQQQLSDGGTSTTPDWNELCESLCKTGDGGSLCNCDLSPFK